MTDKSTSESWDTLTEQLAQLRKDLGNVNAAAADLAKAGAQEGREKVLSEIEALTQQAGSIAEDLSARGHDAGRKAAETAGALGHELEGAVNRNPLAALLIAAGLGLLIGLATRRS